jgi:hypothetical protein
MWSGTVNVDAAPLGYDGAFGGFKASGVGREFGPIGLAGDVEYLTIQVA